jgi:hypothetical protein
MDFFIRTGGSGMAIATYGIRAITRKELRL